MNKVNEIIGERKVAICKIGKFQEDFEYVFDKIVPQFYIDDEYADENYKGRPVWRTTEFLNELCVGGGLKDTFVIVCDIDARKSNCDNVPEWKKLEDSSLLWGKDYIFADELFPCLDYDWREHVHGKKIAFWGVGAQARKFFMDNIPAKENIMPELFLCNNDKYKGKAIHGIEICNADEITDWNSYFVVVMTHDYYDEIYEYLTQKGLAETEDFISYHMIYDRTYARPSEMMRQVVYAQPVKNQPYCQHPFEHLHMIIGGRAYACGCAAYLNNWELSCIGDCVYEDLGQIWNSAAARIFRLTILNNTYVFCREQECPYMNPDREVCMDVSRREAPMRTEVPSRITAELDMACNLSCPSCRKEPIYNNSDLVDRRLGALVAQKLEKSGLLEKTNKLTLAGHGEVFYSKCYRSMLYHQDAHKRKAIHVQSNGTLFTEKEFQHLQECYEEISVTISVDGTKKETYEKLRPGANFDILMKNLENLSVHKKNGEIKWLQVNFVVQRVNYMEWKDLVLLCERLGVDMIWCIHIMNWQNYPPEVFDQMSMANPDGTLKPEMAEVLKDPVFKSPIVKMLWFEKRLETIDKNTE